MLECLLQRLVRGSDGIKERADGVAFLNVAKSAYPISSISYASLNVPLRGYKDRFVHSIMADCWVKHCVSTERLNVGQTAELAVIFKERLDWASLPAGTDPAALRELAGPLNEGWHALSLPLRALGAESVLLCIGAEMQPSDWAQQTEVLSRDFHILGNYFHQHVMRVYGHDAFREMLITARELDCLKWVAAGKTAWEASVILGISERTVRFHLNAAREKLDCRTTTQAVAKAVSHQLISP